MPDMDATACTGAGTGSGHCCHLSDPIRRRCPHLVENQAGRRYACGLVIKYGSWQAMNQSPEYQPIGDHWVAIGRPFNYCETFDPAFCCRPEYRLGRSNENSPLPDPVVT